MMEFPDQTPESLLEFLYSEDASWGCDRAYQQVPDQAGSMPVDQGTEASQGCTSGFANLDDTAFLDWIQALSNGQLHGASTSQDIESPEQFTNSPYNPNEQLFAAPAPIWDLSLSDRSSFGGGLSPASWESFGSSPPSSPSDPVPGGNILTPSSFSFLSLSLPSSSSGSPLSSGHSSQACSPPESTASLPLVSSSTKPTNKRLSESQSQSGADSPAKRQGRGRNKRVLTKAQRDAAVASRPYVCPAAALGACSLDRKGKPWSKACFVRHLNTHIQPGEWQWKCAGVPVVEIRDQSYLFKNRWTLDGREYAGGCMTSLSRKDVLIRHLRDTTECLGDADAAYHEKLNWL